MNLFELPNFKFSDWHNFRPTQLCLLCGAEGEQAICPGCLPDLPYTPDIVCPQCGIMVTVPDTPCGACLKDEPAFDQTHAVFRYAYPLDKLVLRAKKDLSVNRVLAGLMARFIDIENWPACLVPVPMFPADLRIRGYNQALILAREVSHKTGIPLGFEAVRCIKRPKLQHTLNASARKRNVRGIFQAKSPLPKHVAIVDDVMTTGATANELAKTLKRAGVEKVQVWCCARTQMD